MTVPFRWLWLGAVFGPTATLSAQESIEMHGFGEVTLSSRFLSNPVVTNDLLLSEARFRLDLSHFGDVAEFAVKADFVADDIESDVIMDVRQAIVTIRAASWLDIRAGRQVLTWGTGDLVFLNDLFPKDFVSFFTGRDEEFLKAPSNSVKLSFYTDAANLDVVWTPVFTSDRFITGQRLSFFDPSTGMLASAESMGQPVNALYPDKTLDRGEFAARIYETVGGKELALYGYVGFTKQPMAFDPAVNMPTFARLGAYGASIRTGLGNGIGNIEASYYDAFDDRDGTDPDVPNSQVRSLVGYERELVASMTLGMQYSLQWTLAHDALITNSPTPEFEPDELSHAFTLRTTYRFRRNTMTFSLFSYVSPSDRDAHFRPSFTYDWSDALTLSVGGNVMAGSQSGFFGQLEENSNLYGRLRYSF